MRGIFIMNVILFINFGLTVCMVKLKRLNNLEKTFIELNKRCVQLTGVAQYEYLWQIEAEFKTEIYSLKDAVMKLREIYQERLDMAEEYYRIFLNERLIESENMYKIKEKEATEFNIENRRLNLVLAKLEVINENDNITIESKNRLIQQLQEQMELSETKIHGLEVKVSLFTIALTVLLVVLGVFTMLLWFFIGSLCIEDTDKTETMDSSNIDVSSSIECPDKLLNNQHEMRKPIEMPFDKRTEMDDRMTCVQNGSLCIEDTDKTETMYSSNIDVSSSIECPDKLLNNQHEMRKPIEMPFDKRREMDDRMTCVQNGSLCIEDNDKTETMYSSNIDVSSSIECPDKLLNNQHEMRKPIEMPFDKRTEMDDRMTCVQNDNYKTQNIISLDKEDSCNIECSDKLLIILREMRDTIGQISNNCTKMSDRITRLKKKD